MLDFGQGWRQFVKWAMGAVMVFAIALLLSQHLQHAVGILPFVLLLACPLMHLFVHGHHHRHDAEPPAKAQPAEPRETLSHG